LTTTTIAYKCFTHDLRPPVRGGDPVWPGTLPHTLPPIAVDESSAACAAGWSACALASDAIRIGGLWPDGRPSRLFRVETEAQVFSRGDKLRASTWNIVEEIRADDAIREMSAKAFAERADVMAAEQLAWRVALARPRRDVAAVEAGLSNALAIRGLDWTLRPFESAWTAWDARSRGAWDAMGASAARAARTAWGAWDAMGARTAWGAWTAWDARSRGAWDAMGASAARAASLALLVHYAALRSCGDRRADTYTMGARDAYSAGLEVAIPVGPNELGWAMAEGPP